MAKESIPATAAGIRLKKAATKVKDVTLTEALVRLRRWLVARPKRKSSVKLCQVVSFPV
jgi:hypothetical protein